MYLDIFIIYLNKIKYIYSIFNIISIYLNIYIIFECI
jgi:hypothetical protein